MLLSLLIVIVTGCSYVVHWRLNLPGLGEADGVAENTKGAPFDGGAPLALPAAFDAGR